MQFQITVNKFGDYHDFENSKEAIDEFLRNVRSQFKPTGLKLSKSLFVIENIQLEFNYEYKVLDNWRL